MNKSAKGLLIVTLNGLVWRIADDSPNLSNFLATCQTFPLAIWY